MFLQEVKKSNALTTDGSAEKKEKVQVWELLQSRPLQRSRWLWRNKSQKMDPWMVCCLSIQYILTK